MNETGQHVKKLARAGGWKKIGLHSGELTDLVARELGLPEVRTDGGYAVNDLESCDAGLTECEALVAQTGSVLVSAPSAGGRALSVLPPHHVVLARRNQMVPDLGTAFQQMQEKFKDKYPELSFLHQRPQPHRRYRTHSGARRARAEKTDHSASALNHVET